MHVREGVVQRLGGDRDRVRSLEKDTVVEKTMRKFLKRLLCRHAGERRLVRIDRWHPFESETLYAKIMECAGCGSRWSEPISCLDAHDPEREGVETVQDNSRAYCGLRELYRGGQ
jgi:hypothetical protein